MTGGAVAVGGGSGAAAGGSDCRVCPFGIGAGRLLFGGAMFCAGPGVCPGTSWGGRGSGEILKNWAFDSAKEATSQKPTASTNLAPPALVAAILISSDLLFEIAANSSLPRRLSQRERYASASPRLAALALLIRCHTHETRLARGIETVRRAGL